VARPGRFELPTLYLEGKDWSFYHFYNSYLCFKFTELAVFSLLNFTLLGSQGVAKKIETRIQTREIYFMAEDSASPGPRSTI
jgi:hypothetical protein